MDFETFDKIGRLNRDCTITEKVDGTNGQLLFSPEGELLVGSRTRQIWPEGMEGRKACDNYGFALWAYANQEELFAFLGEGRHYGEWAGLGIQRGYSLEKKKFFLFNTGRWGWLRRTDHDLLEIGLTVVPSLYEGPFTTGHVNTAVQFLRDEGSAVNNDVYFDRPEGVIVWHHGTRTYSKVTLEGDSHGKRYEEG